MSEGKKDPEHRRFLKGLLTEQPEEVPFSKRFHEAKRKRRIMIQRRRLGKLPPKSAYGD